MRTAITTRGARAGDRPGAASSRQAVRIFLLRIVSAGIAAASLAGPAAAQVPPARPDPAGIAVRAAAAQPAVGEEVFNEDGVLASPQFTENRVCTRKGCRVFVFDNRSGALINNDGIWTPAYASTGRGGQIIRVEPFSFAEYPQPAPDDKALDAAPAIRRVTRPNSP